MISFKTLIAFIGATILALSFTFAQESKPDHNLEEIYQAVGYPPQALELGIEGHLQIRVLIDQQGRYVRHEVQQEAHELLTNACVQAISQIRLPKATLEGQPMQYWVTVPFDFEIPDEPAEDEQKGE